MSTPICRRKALALLRGAAVAACPPSARAQQPVPVIGFIRSNPAAGSAHLVDAFRRGLKESGLIEGQNVAIEYRWGDDRYDRLPGLVTELIRRPAAVIVANNVAATAARAVTKTVPIVFVSGSDPVKDGLVASLNRPGGNITGASFLAVDVEAKRLGLLHELVPKADVIAVLVDPQISGFDSLLRDIEAGGRALGRKLLILKASNDREIDAAFATIVQSGARALHVSTGAFFTSRRRQLAILAARHGLPASFTLRDYVEVGGLMSYGASITDAYRRAAIQVARILKGEKPGELPVELATKLDLVINLGTARALGIEIPPMLLARADEVIE